MERLVWDRRFDVLTTNKLIGESHHGFHKCRSRSPWRFYIFGLFTLNADNRRAIIIIFLDMARAFYRVPHEKLLLKRTSFGFAYPLYSWWTSYLRLLSSGQHQRWRNTRHCPRHPEWTTSFEPWHAFLIHRRHHESLLFWDICYTANHVQYHGRIELTRCMAWAMNEAIFRNCEGFFPMVPISPK